MLKAYPIILEPAEEGGYIVTIPDFDVSTQGDDYAEALFMARDTIGLCGIDLMDDKKPIPAASDFDSISIDPDLHQVKLLVDVDFAKYRRENDTRAVRKNCTIPAWLNEEAAEQGINFSQVLQDGLKARLGL